MPKPIQVKIFMDTRPAALEEQINGWLGQLGKAAVIRSETVLAAVADKPNIVVTCGTSRSRAETRCGWCVSAY